MTDVAGKAWACPKDGTEMEPRGSWRRDIAWRCPQCKGVFLDVESMRQGRQGKSPMWAMIGRNVAMAALATVIARRVFRRRQP